MTFGLHCEALHSRGVRSAVHQVAMTLEITHLGSGSRGNATLLQTDEAKVLIDCGVSGRQFERRLARIGVEP